MAPVGSFNGPNDQERELFSKCLESQFESMGKSWIYAWIGGGSDHIGNVLYIVFGKPIGQPKAKAKTNIYLLENQWMNECKDQTHFPVCKKWPNAAPPMTTRRRTRPPTRMGVRPPTDPPPSPSIWFQVFSCSAPETCLMFFIHTSSSRWE